MRSVTTVAALVSCNKRKHEHCVTACVCTCAPCCCCHYLARCGKLLHSTLYKRVTVLILEQLQVHDSKEVQDLLTNWLTTVADTIKTKERGITEAYIMY
jgi:hypothetical protein